ncbi:MAG TPA: amino acid ABC transporter ATP-binding protein [Solirubrobacteraceae bacterium]
MHAETTSQPLMMARDVTKRFDHTEVLRGVSFEIGRAQKKVIIGPSGSGKSTLLRCLALLERADSGEIRLDGKEIGFKEQRGRRVHESERELARRRCELGMVFQRFNLFPHLSALDNVALGPRRVRGASRDEARHRASELLNRVGLANRSHAYPSELSGGQQQRVAIARALAMRPALMFFDEPTSALDPELVGEVLDVMESVAAEGMTMVVVTHELRFARRVADTMLMIDDGVVIEEAPPEQLFNAPEHERTRRFFSAIEGG